MSNAEEELCAEGQPRSTKAAQDQRWLKLEGAAYGPKVDRQHRSWPKVRHSMPTIALS